ncbi:MAG: META domain-containing protein [Betaproteobacteria bacterium]|nr:META domain-containing protein [Betaproteobacteria bacterium]
MPLSRATPVTGTVARWLVGHSGKVLVLSLSLSLTGCAWWQKAMERATAKDGSSLPYATLEKTRWQLQSAMLGGTVVAVPRPDRYSVEFQEHHRILVRADCNRGLGAWSAEGSNLSIGPVSYTQTTCAVGSLGKRFADSVRNARSWYIRDGMLFLELPGAGDVLRFAQDVPKS